MKSKLFPSEVYLLRKRVNLSSESSQLFPDETVNQIRMSKQVFKNTRPKKSQPFSRKDTKVGDYKGIIYLVIPPFPSITQLIYRILL